MSGAPKIHHTALEIVEVKVGEPLDFQIFIETEPPTTVSWKVDGLPIQNGTRVKTTYDKSYARIEVQKCDTQDRGIYSIRAINAYGQVERKVFKLVVNGPPKIHHAALEKIEVKVGESLEFQGYVEEDTGAVILWKLDGKLIKNGGRVESTNDGLSAKIRIPKCEVEDNGMYSITAKNEYGEVDLDLFELVVNVCPQQQRVPLAVNSPMTSPRRDLGIDPRPNKLMTKKPIFASTCPLLATLSSPPWYEPTAPTLFPPRRSTLSKKSPRSRRGFPCSSVD